MHQWTLGKEGNKKAWRDDTVYEIPSKSNYNALNSVQTSRTSA